MAKFTTRIELLKAEEKDYDTLQQEIAKEATTGKKKKWLVKPVKLKRGEFSYLGNLTLNDVTDAVLKAVRKTGRDYSFTIMKAKTDF
ncbi:MAG: hypothetical protein QM726_08745 [Chitinophagaceae bacterium]